MNNTSCLLPLLGGQFNKQYLIYMFMGHIIVLAHEFHFFIGNFLFSQKE